MKESLEPLETKNPNRIYFEAFGVKIGIETDARIALQEFIDKFKIALADNFVGINKKDTEYLFTITSGQNRFFDLYKNGEQFIRSRTAEMILEHLETQVRITIAEFAVGKVFLHAGVVGWKGKAIVIPGKSYQGKTTLVAELVKNGAAYFSDEYAVLDENGNVHPFPKMLSLRGIISDFIQFDVAVEEFGGEAAKLEIPVGMILLTEFDIDAEWKPERLSLGQGIMEILPHTIPIRNNPEFALNVLNKIVNRAIISKTQRGEAKVFAGIILEYFETQAI